MRNRKIILVFALLLSIGMVLAACGGSGDKKSDSGNKENADNGDSSNYSAAMVTDVGGVDDKSFNQSAWEGLKAWGEEHDLTKGEGFDYAQSEKDADYMPNLTRLVRNDYDLVFGIGYKLDDAIKKMAGQNEDIDFAIVDSVVDAPNVASITFADHEGSFLAGVAAALKTETDKVGFVGGIDSDLINKFEVGFIAGVKSVNPDIEVDVQYAGGFDAADDGKLIATRMYNDGADIIYHAAGGTGNGVFAQAKDIKQNEPDRDVWVIGVDRDQHEEGQIGEHNITLLSMIKRVDNAVQQVSNQGLNNEFPGGEVLEFGIADEGVGIATPNEEAVTDEMLDAVDEWKEKIVNGDANVPQTHDELKEFEK